MRSGLLLEMILTISMILFLNFMVTETPALEIFPRGDGCPPFVVVGHGFGPEPPTLAPARGEDTPNLFLWHDSQISTNVRTLTPAASSA